MSEVEQKTEGRSRESVFSEWSKLLLEIRSHEQELRKKKERRNALEKRFPFLGSIKGLVHSKKPAQSVPKVEKSVGSKRKAEDQPDSSSPSKRKVDPELKKAIYQYKQELNKLIQKAKSSKKIEVAALEKVVRSAGSFGSPIPEEKEEILREAAGVSSSEFLKWFEEARRNVLTIQDEDGSKREVSSDQIPLFRPQSARENLNKMEVVPSFSNFSSHSFN